MACFKCKSVLAYDSHDTGVSHLQRHINSCLLANFKQNQITKYLKISLTGNGLNDAKTQIIKGCESLVSCDLIPFSVVEWSGFAEYSQEIINMAAKYGKVDINYIIPSAKTVKRKLYSDLKKFNINIFASSCQGWPCRQYFGFMN